MDGQDEGIAGDIAEEEPGETAGGGSLASSLGAPTFSAPFDAHGYSGAEASAPAGVAASLDAHPPSAGFPTDDTGASNSESQVLFLRRSSFQDILARAGHP